MFKDALGDSVVEIRTTDRLVESPARVVNAEGALSPEMQKMYHLMQQNFEKQKKILEINPDHPLISRIRQDESLRNDVIQQVLDSALMMDGRRDRFGQNDSARTKPADPAVDGQGKRIVLMNLVMVSIGERDSR